MSPGGPLTVFVYFKAPAGSEPAVRAALDRVGAEMLAAAGVEQRHGPRHRVPAPGEPAMAPEGALPSQTRAGPARRSVSEPSVESLAEPQTWLEIYEPVAPSALQGFLAALEAAAAEAGLAALALQGRHLEVFECAPPGAFGAQRPCA